MDQPEQHRRQHVGSAKYIFSPKLTFNVVPQSCKTAYGETRVGTVINSPLETGDKLTTYQGWLRLRLDEQL